MERLGLVPPTPTRACARWSDTGSRLLVEEAVGPERAAEGVRLFRERYPQVAVSGSHLLPGVAETLGELSARGYAMALASNKPAPFSRMILEAKGVAAYFRQIEGPDRETPTKPDPAMLTKILAREGVSPEAAVAVGDMEVDVRLRARGRLPRRRHPGRLAHARGARRRRAPTACSITSGAARLARARPDRIRP